ncbi:MAG: biotin/lipoyl-binding protein [Acidobacteria bacterium]|nr:biotin/lipoyl-binding protein [Acidobacteriota bacterium]
MAAVRAIRRPAAVAVEVGSPARRATFRSTVTASGEIVPTRYADIGSSVMGKIVRLPVAEGDRVKAGQILAYIDAVQARSDVSGAAAQTRALEAEAQAATEQVRAAAADLAAAEALARDADKQLARNRQLADQQLLPGSVLDSSLAASEAAAAQAASSRAALERARRSLDAASRRVAQAESQQVTIVAMNGSAGNGVNVIRR